MADIATNIEAQGLALAIKTATGEEPVVDFAADGSAQLYFTEDAAKRLSNRLYDSFGKPPGKIKVNMAPVVLPAVIRKYGIYVAIAVLAVYFAGRQKFPL
jgi:hypothetical protein